MKTVVLIPCTDRKRIRPAEQLWARNLAAGSLEDVSAEWGRRISNADERVTPDQLYCGRAYREGRLAADMIGAELAVISAGHGIVREGHEIAPYGLTVAPGKPDSVQSKVNEEWSSAKWWQALGERSTASVNLNQHLRQASADLVLISLSENYAKLLSQELVALDEQLIGSIRIFGAGLARHLPPNVRPCFMPYDVRLNGYESPIRGTMSDFPTRALHHFAMGLSEGALSGKSCAQDQSKVEDILNTWSAPEIPVRKKLSDQEVISFILRNWEKTDGRSGASLRLLRDSGNACEQSRFKDLFRLAAANRIEAVVGLDDG